MTHTSSLLPGLQDLISQLNLESISDERKEILRPLTQFIRAKSEKQEPIRINFICTHNSRRSHISQVWSHVAAAHFHIPDVHCYSDGTEETALFPKVAEPLQQQGNS